jgi:hypothetical protein
MPSPGFGPVGFGIGLIAGGGMLIAKGNDIAGLACDLFGGDLYRAAFGRYGGV